MAGTVSLSFSEDRALATLCLGTPDERAIALNPTRMASFVAALEQVARSQVKGLIIRAPSPDSFCVGADVGLIQSVTNPKIGMQLATEGQRAFDLLEDLQCTTVAAIGGACVGGGCELVLACDYRIMTDCAASSIGLPETKLGILPGFGGTYRLPRLVGLPKALDIILAGKTLRAQQAIKAGLVDQLTSTENLYQVAETIARGEKQAPSRKRPVIDRLLSNNPLGRTVVRTQASKTLRKQTKGFYPAPPQALKVTTEGLARSRSRGMQVEAAALGELITTPESKALVNLFFLTEAAKGLGKSARREIEGVDALVVGAGIMGAGIAGSLARSGHHVIVRDNSEAALQRGRDHVGKELSKLRYLSSLERGGISTHIDWLQFPSSSMKRTGIVIEAVFEDMGLKKTIFRDISGRVSPDCILTTNTSSLSVTEMASVIERPERFVGMHFFNPVEKMPLVEIIRGAQTNEATVAKVAALSTQIGKFPIVVRDVPGFLINRTLIPYLNEATFLLQEGYSVDQIDQAALDFGMPMGPIRLLDEVGLDVADHVSKVMVDGYGERMAAPDFAGKLLSIGRKGRKSSAGFYDYRGKDATPWPGLRSALNLPATPRTRLSKQEITERLIYHLVNEAMKCLNEGVAGDDRDLAKKQIDLGTVMGIGFPPFRGGVIYFAEKVGLDSIQVKLKDFEARLGIRYRPF